VWVVLFGCIPLLVLLFPDGQLPSRRWRPLVWAVAAAIADYEGGPVWHG
jgi:two-component system, NarL family, sensor kinase